MIMMDRGGRAGQTRFVPGHKEPVSRSESMSKLLAAAGLLGYLAGADAFAAGPGLSHAPRCGHHAGRASGGVGGLCMKSAKALASSEVDGDTNGIVGVDSVRRSIIGGGAALAAGTIVGSPYGQEAFAEGASAVEFSTISTDLPCAKILTGMWQLSGGHGFKPDKKAAVAAMKEQVEAGFTTFDLADHYGDAEPITSLFRATHPDLWKESRFFTKWVPMPGPMPRKKVEAAIDNRLRRMGTDSLDLLQFHWWDYKSSDQYMEALGHMQDMVTEGKIKHLAVTNFDTDNFKASRDGGINLVSNQVQFSLIDQRPLAKMAPYCGAEGAKILAYGTVCGGFLSDKYVGRAKLSRDDFDTVSKQKYYNMIDAWGGWPLFQELLSALSKIGAKHGVSVTNVATRWVIEQPAVAGAIVGARLGLKGHDHSAENMKVFSFSLDDSDKALIASVTTRSNNLLKVIGDCGDEYRG